MSWKSYRGVVNARPAGGAKLAVRFRGDPQIRAVDLDGWIDDVHVLQPLRDPLLFACAAVTEDGRAVRWTDALDIGGDQLWRLAGEQAGELMEAAAFVAWCDAHGLSLAAAAEALGMPQRVVARYRSGEAPIPKTVLLATRGYDAGARLAA